MGDVVRKTKAGRFIGWYVRYRDADGKRKQRASHQPSHALARRYLLEVEGRVARGVLGIPEPALPSPTVSELIERFLVEYSRARIKDLAKYRRYARTALRRALPLVGSMRADAVTTTDIDRLRHALHRNAAPGSVRLTLDFLKTVFAWAVKQKLAPANPLRGVEKPAAAAALDFLSRAEADALLSLTDRKSAAGALFDRMRHACIHFALHTGLRRGELYGLRWCDLDAEARRLTVARSYRATPKSGRPRHLRLPDAVLPILAAWRKSCPKTVEDLVFPVVPKPKPRQDPQSRPRMGKGSDTLELTELLIESGCRKLERPWHALRHTFASHFVMSGGNILSLQKILGHSDIKMTLVYAHLQPDFLGDEMNKVKYR